MLPRAPLITESIFASGRVSDKMIEILWGRQFNDVIPAGLPRETRAAHNTGPITKHNHDAAIVYADGRKAYVNVVLARGIEKEKEGDKLIAAISRAVYQSVVK